MRQIALYRLLIRIVPEWNVKDYDPIKKIWGGYIRIVPEWNVKLGVPVSGLTPGQIRIVPEWNVKLRLKFIIQQFQNH